MVSILSFSNFYQHYLFVFIVLDEDIDGVPIEDSELSNTSLQTDSQEIEEPPQRNDPSTQQNEQQSNADVRFSVHMMPIPSFDSIYEKRGNQQPAESNQITNKKTKKKQMQILILIHPFKIPY